MSERSDLAALLEARGFAPGDAGPFVQRLSAADVASELRWHRWEESWWGSGVPMSDWPADVKAAISQHYLNPPHSLTAQSLLALYSRNTPLRSPPSTGPSTTEILAGLAFIAVAGAVAWRLGK